VQSDASIALHKVPSSKSVAERGSQRHSPDPTKTKAKKPRSHGPAETEDLDFCKHKRDKKASVQKILPETSSVGAIFLLEMIGYSCMQEQAYETDV